MKETTRAEFLAVKAAIRYLLAVHLEGREAERQELLAELKKEMSPNGTTADEILSAAVMSEFYGLVRSLSPSEPALRLVRQSEEQQPPGVES